MVVSGVAKESWEKLLPAPWRPRTPTPSSLSPLSFASLTLLQIFLTNLLTTFFTILLQWQTSDLLKSAVQTINLSNICMQTALTVVCMHAIILSKEYIHSILKGTWIIKHLQRYSPMKLLQFRPTVLPACVPSVPVPVHIMYCTLGIKEWIIGVNSLNYE